MKIDDLKSDFVINSKSNTDEFKFDQDREMIRN